VGYTCSPSEQRFAWEETYERTRRPAAAAETIVREAYTDEGFFALERERVFGRSWVAVGPVAALRRPGDLIAAAIADRSVIVVRGLDGELRGFYNACRHRGTRLLPHGAGHVRRSIRCPYHSWAYALDGACIGTPLFEGSEIPADQQAIFDTGGARAFERADQGLLGVRVATWGPLAFACLDPDAPGLGEQLGDLPRRCAGYRLDEWEVARSASYEIAANYKLVAENFMEYYHLPWVHPGLVKVSPLEAHHRWQGAGMYTGMCTRPIAADSEQGGWQSGLPPLAGLSGDDAISARFVWLFPNVALNVLPNHLFLIHAEPVAPGATHETTWLLTHPESASGPGAEAATDRLAAFWDEVNREDIAIVERVQDGLASTPFPGGRLCYRFEEPLHRFQNMVIDHMVGRRRVPPGDREETAPMFAAGARRTGGPAGDARRAQGR
jgi:phenylpropionate dioxygenase-like ring-hydroxylating dioxygenase large terminal subunit